jgi:hypothetical protein
MCDFGSRFKHHRCTHRRHPVAKIDIGPLQREKHRVHSSDFVPNLASHESATQGDPVETDIVINFVGRDIARWVRLVSCAAISK